MKTIVWTSQDITKRSDTARVLKVSAVLVPSRKGKPRHLGTITQSFQSDAGMLMILLDREKALPRRAFARGSHGWYALMPHHLEEEGLARVVHL